MEESSHWRARDLAASQWVNVCLQLQCSVCSVFVKVKCKKLLESVCANFAPNETYTYVFGGWVEPMRDVLSRMRQYRFQQHATRMLLTERRQVAHAAQVGDPAVVRRVVRRYLARREVARARHLRSWVSRYVWRLPWKQHFAHAHSTKPVGGNEQNTNTHTHISRVAVSSSF